MKKLIAIGFLAFTFPSVFALSCVDLKVNLKRGSESGDVLALQNFLFNNGFLKATPNGYFGPATLKAAQAYQKSVGLPSSGLILGLTRAAIKKDSCTGGGATVSTSTPVSIPKTTSTIKKGPQPFLSSLDKATVILGGQTEWGIVLKGGNFSTTSNAVYLVKRDYSKRYSIGAFPSSDGKLITLPKSLGDLTFPCGTSCGRQRLQEGEYFVIVETESGGESTANEYIVVKDSTIVSGSVSQNAIPYAASSTRLGVFVFKANTPLTIGSIKFNLAQGAGTSTKLSNIVFRDEKTGQEVFKSASSSSLYEGEDKRIAVYADVESVKSIQAMTSFTISVIDSINNKKTTTFTSPSTTISFEGEPAAITELKRIAAIAPATITAVDRNFVFANGDTAWSINVTGTSFATSTNIVYLKSRIGGRKYKLGTLSSSSNRTVIALPKSLGNTYFWCGNDCSEKIAPGDYDLIIDNGFGESNAFLLTVYSFNVSSRSGTEESAIQPIVSNARLGTVSFGTNVSQVVLSSVVFNFSLYKNTSAVTGIVLKDDITQQALANAGKDTLLMPNDTKVVSAYASVKTTAATGGTGYFTVSVIEPIGKKVTTFTTSKFQVTLSYY